MSDSAGMAKSHSPAPDERPAAEPRGFGPVGMIATLGIAAGQILAPLSAVLVSPSEFCSRYQPLE